MVTIYEEDGWKISESLRDGIVHWIHHFHLEEVGKGPVKDGWFASYFDTGCYRCRTKIPSHIVTMFNLLRM